NQGKVEGFARRKRTLRFRPRGDPGRVLENGPDEADKFHPIHRIQLGQLWHRLVGVNELIVRRNGETDWSSLRQGAGAGAEGFARRTCSYAEGPRSRRALDRRCRIFLHQRRQHEGGGDRYDQEHEQRYRAAASRTGDRTLRAYSGRTFSGPLRAGGRGRNRNLGTELGTTRDRRRAASAFV